MFPVSLDCPFLIALRPSLPVMDIEGDIIGTDGHYMVKYEADGTQVKPAIAVEAVLYPLYR
jgi:hypothetical protein